MKLITTHYINGRSVQSKGQETFDLINPSNRQVVGRVTLGNEEDARDAIGAAQAALAEWAATTLDERREHLQRIHDAIVARTDEHIAAIMEEYGGRTMVAAKATIAAAAKAYLSTKNLLGDVHFMRAFGDATVTLKPLGVAGLITPWNANTFNASIKIAPAIAAGCTVVLKPSEMSAMQTQVLLASIHDAGLPAGVINVVNGRGDVVGTELTRNPHVAKISFTGSTAVGKTIIRNAADTMKRTTLELGGKSATIFLDDADLSKAIPFALRAAFMNSGQACIAGTRLLIPRSRAEEITSALKDAVSKIKVGNTAEPDTIIGPMVSANQYERVQGYIRKGIEQGAEILIGGEGHPKGLEGGYFVKPTVFVNVTNDMTIAREEIFGPVLSVITYQTDDDAVRIANDSTYGLFAWISTADAARGKRMANRLETGGVMINEVVDVHNYPQVPAGGFKQSGIGRELGAYGIEEYLQTQSVYGPPV